MDLGIDIEHLSARSSNMIKLRNILKTTSYPYSEDAQALKSLANLFLLSSPLEWSDTFQITAVQH